jgi:MerR family transcriptional regulator, copper efflux regulator
MSRDTNLHPIGDLANLTGESVKTLRFWTDQKLLQAERADNGYRLYGSESLERVTFIRTAQTLGLTLERISELLTWVDEDVNPCERVKDLLRTHLEHLQQTIALFQKMENRVKQTLERTEEAPCLAHCRFLPLPVTQVLDSPL